MSGTNLDVAIGVGLRLRFTCKDENGDPSDLTGYTAYSQARLSPTEEAGAIDFEPAITDPLTGIIEIDFDTSDVTPGVYGWDIVVKQSGQLPIYITGGNIKFRRKNTQTPP
jgi:hypothetical protein